jgi:radical SAM superfamily enzyme YgiQ (UPF0313 family)
LAYIAAVAEKHGHEAKIIDAEASNLQNDKIILETAKFNPDIIGMTTTSTSSHILINLAKELKRNFARVPIVIGGPHITILKERAFDPLLDYGFVGEAEESWGLFLQQYENREDFSEIKGLVYREGGQVKFSGGSCPVMNIDLIPFPARHLLDFNNYNMGTLRGTRRCTTILTTRGCPFKCIFCNTGVFGDFVRRRSLDLVIKEMEECIRKYHIEHFYFMDDTLTLSREYMLEFCDRLISKNLHITFEGSTRANLLDEKLISRLAKAGLIRLSFGLESVDPHIREIMKKNVPLEAYIVANRLTNKYNIETLNSCMLGLPGETISTFRDTLRFLRNSREIKQANLSIATPYPGTELYEMAKRRDYGLKLLTDDFSKFRRYGNAVMSVGNLSPSNLVMLQNDGFVSIYLAPWRLASVFKKNGIMGLLLTLLRLLKSSRRIIVNKNGLFWFSRQTNQK